MPSDTTEMYKAWGGAANFYRSYGFNNPADWGNGSSEAAAIRDAMVESYRESKAAESGNQNGSSGQQSGSGGSSGQGGQSGGGQGGSASQKN